MVKSLPMDVCVQHSFVLPLQHQSMAAHLLSLLTPPRWELHKGKQQRRNKVRYGTLEEQNLERWRQHPIVLASKLVLKKGVISQYSVQHCGQGQGVLCFVNMLSPSIRCPKCHGCVETQPCLNRSRENAPSAWKSAPDNIHSFRNS